MPFHSDANRRAYFAKLHAGKIGRYKSTLGLYGGKKWWEKPNVRHKFTVWGGKINPEKYSLPEFNYDTKMKKWIMSIPSTFEEVGGKERNTATMNMNSAMIAFKRAGFSDSEILDMLKKSGFTEEEIKGGKAFKIGDAIKFTWNRKKLRGFIHDKNNARADVWEPKKQILYTDIPMKALKGGKKTKWPKMSLWEKRQELKKKYGGKAPPVEVKEDVRFVGFHPGNRIIIDKDVPAKYRKSLIKHEHVEHLMQKEGIPYPIAHKVAEKYEKQTFPHGKKEWSKYNKIVNRIYHDNVAKGVVRYKS